MQGLVAGIAVVIKIEKLAFHDGSLIGDTCIANTGLSDAHSRDRAEGKARPVLSPIVDAAEELEYVGVK